MTTRQLPTDREIDVAQLPVLPLEHRQRLPDEPAIYFVLDGDGTVHYIGKAKRLLKRWQAHHRITQVEIIPGARIAWLSVSDQALLSEVEAALIQHFEPRLNGSPAVPLPGGDLKLGVRLPKSLVARLDEDAEASVRTRTQQIEYLLRLGLEVEARRQKLIQEAGE